MLSARGSLTGQSLLLLLGVPLGRGAWHQGVLALLWKHSAPQQEAVLAAGGMCPLRQGFSSAGGLGEVPRDAKGPSGEEGAVLIVALRLDCRRNV